MLAGHYSTALLAHQKFPNGKTLLFFLLASQVQDLAWLILHYLGLEPTVPSDVFNVTVNNMSVDMHYSHDLLSQIFWLVLVFVVGRVLFKSNKIGLAGSALVAGHFLLDVISGYPHHVFGEGTHNIGLALYVSNVYLAVAIEAVFCVLALVYLFKQEAKEGIQRTSKNKAAIIGLFVFGIAFMLSIASISFRQWLSLPEFDLGFNTNIPALIIIYIGMLFYLNYFVPKFTVEKKSLPNSFS